MAKNQRDFFKKKNEWSEIKDTLLRCYLPQYFQKLLVSGKPIFYIDCFAGKGKFDDGNDGSPLIAMQIINERLGMSRISRKNNAIVPCFIELNHAADLEQNLMLHPYQYGTPQVVDGKFEDNIRGLLKDKRGYNVFLYIDPYGIQALDSQLFDEIGTYGFRSFEMLINFNSFGFFRDACRVMKVDISQDDALMGLDDLVEYEPTTVTASPQSENLLTRIAGGNYWMDIVRDFQAGRIDGYQAERRLSAEYKQHLKQKYKYVLDMPIRLKPGQRPKYRMIHVCDHEDGCFLMAENMQRRKDVVKALQSTEGGEIPTDVIGDSFENSTIETWTVRPTRPAPAQRPARPKQQVPGQMSLGDSPSPETGNEPSAQEVTQQTPSQSGSTSFGAPAAPASGTTDTIRPVSGVSSETPANGAAAGAEPSGATEPQPAPEDVPEEPELDREAIVKAINDAGLLTYDVRRVRINDYLKSLFSLTRLLTQSGLQPSASYDVVNEIVEMIRSFIKKTKDEGRYDELATQVLQFKLKTQTFDVFGESVDDHAEMDLFSTTDTDLDRQFRLAELKLGNEGVGIRYGTRYADDDNPAGYKIDVIIFAADADCMDMLHNYARSRFHDINDANRRRITGLTERYRKKYDSIVSDGDIISKHNFRLPETISIERSNVGEAYTDHLFVDNATGKAVINLNNWEKAVLQAERGRSDYICWLRNPPRKSWSLCIPYEQNAEKKSMYPDFLIIRKDEMGFVIDILEPHDGTRTDNLGKAKGFAEYARQNPGVGRLQLIRLLNGRIKRLDMSRSAVRDRVSHAMSNDELDHIFDEDGFFG